MVRLTADCIERKCSRILSSKSLSKQFSRDRLWKITHLHMDDMYISNIDNISACKNLKVVYLQHNNISKIENLHFAVNLTHLYLQHNEIKKLENLDTLRNLQKLHLGYNCISVVEGLESTNNLVELHIEKQKLGPGDTLCFDPRSTKALQTCLKVLDVSGNKLSSLRSIDDFCRLEVLEARDNKIDSIGDVTETIITLTSLKDLCLQGNPVTRQFRYRENLIANSDSLINLEGKTVSDVCRRFMKKFKIEKHLRQTTKKRASIALGDDISSSLNLPPAFKQSISRAIFQHPGPKLSITVTSASGATQPQIFPPWKSTLKTQRNHASPRPIRRSVIKDKKPCVERSVMKANSIALPPI